MSNDKYTEVFGSKTPIGFIYRIKDDSLMSFNKNDCAWRIKNLFNSGAISKERKNELLSQLKQIKRK